jgi:hypothetical protein
MLIVKKSENREKALAYIRVSSQRQVDEGVSLDAQKESFLSLLFPMKNRCLLDNGTHQLAKAHHLIGIFLFFD